MQLKESIFLLETFVTEIHFVQDYKVHNPDAITVKFEFGNLCNFDLDPHFMKVNLGLGPSNDVVLNMGKSFMYSCSHSTMKKMLAVEPLRVTVMFANKPIGQCTIPFKADFIEMLRYFETIGIVKSCSVQHDFPMIDENKKKIGSVAVNVRLSCFGGNIQTQYYLRETEEKQEYIFRYKNTGDVLKCEKTEDETFVPISPLYGIVGKGNLMDSDVNVAENTSLTSVFNAKTDEYVVPKMEVDKTDYDVLSLCFKPSENKFFDLLNYITADVKTVGKATCVKIKTTKDFNKDLESFMTGMQKPASKSKVAPELTEDRIEKMLCKRKDCPAARKFKEYGIGPLATGKGLGTLYNFVEPPVLYGLSHTYGTMENYGPYGVFSKPKRPEDDFVPAADISEVQIGPCRQKVRDEELNSQEVTCPPKDSSSKTSAEKPKCCKHQKLLKMRHSKGCPLRLSGGDVQSQNSVLRLRGGGEETSLQLETPKSPEDECRDVMDQLDEILNSYKRAIGPCGQATCPYGLNFAEENCKKACERPLTVPDDDAISCESIPCGMSVCPYAAPLKKAYPAGCGSPKCAYTKYKLGLVDDDAALELLYLPEAISGKCGHPKCKYPLEPELPPIHWDCPDPLPKGVCKNPNCPLLPPDLRKFKTKTTQPTGPCGSPNCPYALPVSCGNPTCPFKENPCPFFKDQQMSSPPGPIGSCPNTECSYNKKKKNSFERDTRLKADITQNSDSLLAQPNCSERKKEDICKNPNCPSVGADDKSAGSITTVSEENCGNPTCPFTKMKAEKAARKKSKRRSKKNVKKRSFCDNPDCEAKEKSSICSNPSCPSKETEKSKGEGDEFCTNPDCPFSKQKPKKKEKKQKKNICGNPNCPDRERKSKESMSSNTSACSNPKCPRNQKKKLKKQSSTSSENSNSASVCDNPICPYVQPLPSCGVPNCPFEPPCGVVVLTRPCPGGDKKARRNSSKHSRRKLEKRRSSPPIGSNPSKHITEVTAGETTDEPNITYEQEVIENPNGDTVITTSIRHIEKTEAKKDPSIVKKVKKKKGKFVYSIGDKYPGFKVGHKECVMPLFHVPAHMGWLWNIHTPVLQMKPRRGWRPGALTKTIARIIRAHRQARGLGILRVPKFRRDGLQIDDDDDIIVKPKPTLTIQKKEGSYWVTVNPLKDPYSLAENENPYMDCTPMTFKITKNKKKVENYCCCDGDGDEEHIPVSASSSNSELDIEFTPPAGIIHPARFKKKRNVIHCDTQYNPKDCAPVKKKEKKGKKGNDKAKGGKGGKGGKGKGKKGKK